MATESEKQRDEVAAYGLLVKQVFGNSAGDKLMSQWEKIFNSGPVYRHGGDSIDMAFNDGLRTFYLNIRSIVEANDD